MSSSDSAAVVRGVRQGRIRLPCTEAYEQPAPLPRAILWFFYSGSLLIYASAEPVCAAVVGRIKVDCSPHTRKARRHLPCV